MSLLNINVRDESCLSGSRSAKLNLNRLFMLWAEKFEERAGVVPKYSARQEVKGDRSQLYDIIIALIIKQILAVQ